MTWFSVARKAHREVGTTWGEILTFYWLALWWTVCGALRRPRPGQPRARAAS